MQKKTIVVVGSLNVDLVTRVARNPEVGETLMGSSFQTLTGGKGANQAVAAALLGAEVQMIGRHGMDGFEARLLATLREKRVDVAAVTPAEGPSGVANILVTDDGHNSIVVVPGSNGQLCATDVHSHRDLIAQAGIVLTQLETPLASLLATLEIAESAHVPVMLDPAPAQKLDPGIFRRITWLTPNETEAAMLLQQPTPSGAALEAFAEEVLSLGSKYVVLKLGSKGAYLATRSGLREYVAAPSVLQVDSTAAGDALNGALAVALTGGADPVEAVRFGVAAASLSVTKTGAIPSLPTLEELRTFMSKGS